MNARRATKRGASATGKSHQGASSAEMWEQSDINFNIWQENIWTEKYKSDIEINIWEIFECIIGKFQVVSKPPVLNATEQKVAEPFLSIFGKENICIKKCLTVLNISKHSDVEVWDRTSSGSPTTISVSNNLEVSWGTWLAHTWQFNIWQEKCLKWVWYLTVHYLAGKVLKMSKHWNEHNTWQWRHHPQNVEHEHCHSRPLDGINHEISSHWLLM